MSDRAPRAEMIGLDWGIRQLPPGGLDAAGAHSFGFGFDIDSALYAPGRDVAEVARRAQAAAQTWASLAQGARS